MNENRWIPSLSDIRTMLARYFIGATEADADRLRDELHKIVADPDKHDYYHQRFDPQGQGYRTRGLAWREELTFGKRFPEEAVDLAAFVATWTPSFPKPRPYCPDIYVGTWVQAEDLSVTWELRSDGTFATNDGALTKYVRWHCIHHRDHYLDTIRWFDVNDRTYEVMVIEWSARALRVRDLYKKERRFTRA